MMISETFVQNKGSHSLLESIASLQNTISSGRFILFHIFTLNFKTLLRNTTSQGKGFSNESIIKSTFIDLQTILENITLYLKIVKEQNKNIKPMVIVYNPIYNIPEKNRKTTNNILEIRLHEIYSKYSKTIKEDITITKQNDIQIITASLGKKTYPHLELLTLLEKYKEDSIDYKFKNHLAVSHLPLDLHIYPRCKNFYILESYTGALRSSQVFGIKYFKDENIPFNTITHTVLGDTYQLKPMVTYKEKKIIKNIAKVNKWPYKTKDMISNDIEKILHISKREQNSLQLL